MIAMKTSREDMGGETMDNILYGHLCQNCNDEDWITKEDCEFCVMEYNDEKAMEQFVKKHS